LKDFGGAGNWPELPDGQAETSPTPSVLNSAKPARNMALGNSLVRSYNRLDLSGSSGARCFSIYSGILIGRCSMFESLSERIKEDERGTVNNTQRTIFWVGIFVVVAAGLFFGIKLFG
jgi:hypothetical protein